jgi:hypothetical protein
MNIEKVRIFKEAGYIYLKVILHCSPRKTQYNRESQLSEWPVSGSRVEPRT